MWGWHDGADVPSDAPTRVYGINPLMTFARLEVTVDWCRQRRAIAHDTDPDDADRFWAPSWFPLFELRKVACECAVEEGSPAPVLDADTGKTARYPEIVAPSFGEMAHWWIEALETGGWACDRERGRWQHNLDLIDPARERTGLV